MDFGGELHHFQFYSLATFYEENIHEIVDFFE